MDRVQHTVRIRAKGPYACFTRPEMKVERVSYDVMTPSAARGILEAVYWKPQIAWVIDRIHVLNPIRFSNVRRNEVGARGPSARTLKSYMSGKSGAALGLRIEDERQQRATTLLVDVDYVIDAHFVVLDPSEHPRKHYEVFQRRAMRGQRFHQPYLGCREFDADVEWAGDVVPDTDPQLAGERDLGWMLLDIDYRNDNQPIFFRATLRDGILDVPPLDSSEVRR